MEKKKDRLELEEAITKWFMNAKAETQERVLENILFKMSYDELEDLFNGEVMS